MSDIIVYHKDPVWGWVTESPAAVPGRQAFVAFSGNELIRLAVREKDVVWAPGYEQTNFIYWAQNLVDTVKTLREHLSNSPTFFSPDTIKPNLEIQDAILSQDWENKIDYFRDSVIRPAIELAAKTGFNTIDLAFYNDSAFHNASACSSSGSVECRSYAKHLAFSQWIEEIKRHNLESPGSALRIRARIQAWFQHFVEFYQSFDQVAYLSFPSPHCVVYPDSDKDSLLLGITNNPYLARSLGRYDRDLRGGYFNLKDPLVKRMMTAFLCVSLEELQKETGPEIEIDAVALVLDKDGETGLSFLEINPEEVITRPGTNESLGFPIFFSSPKRTLEKYSPQNGGLTTSTTSMTSSPFSRLGKRFSMEPMSTLPPLSGMPFRFFPQSDNWRRRFSTRTGSGTPSFAAHCLDTTWFAELESSYITTPYIPFRPRCNAPRNRSR